jgi:hypothetical protein
VAAGLVVAAYAAALRRYGIFDPIDEGLLLVQAARVAHGQVPYVDFHTGYGPLYFRLQALLVSAGGIDAVRWALVAVHGAAGALLYVLARRLGGAALAIAAVALEIAFFLPVSPRQGAPFNAPYPGWYAGLAGVALAVLLGGGTVPVLRLGLAGALAGVVFAIKPNSGLLLAAGAAAAVVLAGTDRTGPRAVRLTVLALVVIGALLLVVPTGLTVAAFVLVAPVVGLLLLGMERGAPDGDALRRLGALAAGFVVVAAVSYAGTLATIGPARFMREVLLVGAGVAELYAVPLPWTVGLAAVVGLVAFALRGRYPRALFVAAGISLVLALLAGGGDAVSGVSAVRRGAEAAALALLPLALWGVLTVVRRRPDAALVAPTAVAAAAALQAYPRPDFVHLMPLGALVLPLALRLWRSGVGLLLPARAAGVAACLLAIVLAAGRFVPTLGVLERVATGRVFEVSLGPTEVVMEAAGVLPLRALADTAETIRHLPADESVLSFPACGIVLFLADRLPAGPHDYFYPGRPERAEVAALVSRWEEEPPHVALTCRAAGTALEAAWEAYPELVRFLDTRYTEVVSWPPYTVRERR